MAENILQRTDKGTIPLTIVQAIVACRNRSGSGFPIDFLAVVVGVEKTDKLARLWIHDASLQHGRRAEILFFGKRKRNDIVEKLRVQTGDVMRFNRIDLRQQTTAGNDVFSFWHSNKDTEAGAEYFRLCHLDGATGQVDMFTAVDVPASMQTNFVHLEELILWYRTSSLFEQVASLQTTLCQRRTLAEFSSCLGVVGHAVAHVIHCEVRSCSHSAKKRQGYNRRGMPAVSNSLVFATLTDDYGITVMTFCLQNSMSDHWRYQRLLGLAQGEKRPVRLLRVVAKSACQFKSSIQTDEILLVTTSDSDISLAFNEELNHIISRRKDSPTESQQHTSNGMHHALPVEFLKLVPQIKNHLASDKKGVPTQTNELALKLPAHVASNEILDLLSPIFNITVKGISLAHQLRSRDRAEASRFLHFLFKSPYERGSFSYSAATISLRVRELGEVNVEADCAILKRLCGGLEIDEWPPSVATVKKGPSSYNNLVLDMILGILSGHVVFRWKIRRFVHHSGQILYQASAVSLLAL